MSGQQQVQERTETQHIACRDCQRIDTADTLAAGRSGVGWCVAQSQYRSLQIERQCDDFRFMPK